MQREYHQSRAVERVTLAKELGHMLTRVSVGYLRALLKGKCAEQKSFSVLKDRVRENAMELYGLRNLPVWYNPKDFYSSKVELNSQQAFGKNNPLKSYTVLQIAVIVWKSGYLSKVDGKPTALAKALPCKETTLSMISNLAQVDFSALKLLSFDHGIYDDPEKKNRRS